MNLFKWVIAAISMGDSHRKFSTRYSAVSHFNVGLCCLGPLDQIRQTVTFVALIEHVVQTISEQI